MEEVSEIEFMDKMGEDIEVIWGNFGEDLGGDVKINLLLPVW